MLLFHTVQTRESLQNLKQLKPFANNETFRHTIQYEGPHGTEGATAPPRNVVVGDGASKDSLSDYLLLKYISVISTREGTTHILCSVADRCSEKSLAQRK